MFIGERGRAQGEGPSLPEPPRPSFRPAPGAHRLEPNNARTPKATAIKHSIDSLHVPAVLYHAPTFVKFDSHLNSLKNSKSIPHEKEVMQNWC